MLRTTLTLLVLCPVLSAQTWTQAKPVSSPSTRYDHAQAYDAARQRVVLFGGRTSSEYSGDTWLWDGKTWKQAKPIFSPTPRRGHSMTYDAVRQQVVLFGGFTKSGYMADTWLWNGKTWTRAKPTSSPSARINPSMAYDAANKQSVLFGGYTTSGMVADTWTWNGKTWTPQILLKLAPSARHEHAMAYDASHQQVVLFGGETGSSGSKRVGDTWLWNGKIWTQAKPGSSPSARSDHAMAYDPANKQVILFGGATSSHTAGDTWTWNGKAWKIRKPTPSPSARHSSSMAYDAARKQVVLFGGGANSRVADTWLYDAGFRAVFTRYGKGCGRSPSVTLLAASTSYPQLGTNFKMITSNAPLDSAAAVIAAGTSKTNFGLFTLPILLSPFGMPGCNLYQSYDWTWVFAMRKGAGQFTLPIPNNAKLLGAKLHFQAIVSAPKVNAAQLLSSNGGTIVIGNK